VRLVDVVLVQVTFIDQKVLGFPTCRFQPHFPRIQCLLGELGQTEMLVPGLPPSPLGFFTSAAVPAEMVTI
jgi:hypothetical protein